MPPKVKVIGDLHSVPHYRCGMCKLAVQVYEDDEKPSFCPWCHVMLDWEVQDDNVDN